MEPGGRSCERCGARAGRGELRLDGEIESTVSMFVGPYYAQYLPGHPLPEDWPEEAMVGTS